jgi:hypothetical protein
LVAELPDQGGNFHESPSFWPKTGILKQGLVRTDEKTPEPYLELRPIPVENYFQDGQNVNLPGGNNSAWYFDPFPGSRILACNLWSIACGWFPVRVCGFPSSLKDQIK